MNEYRAIGVFPNRLETENALLEIKSSGFPMHNLSVIGRNTYMGDRVAGVAVHANIDNKIDEVALADEGALEGAATGGALAGITGLLVGLGTLAIPGVGPVLLAGEAATALAGTAIGAGGASLLGALVGSGVADNQWCQLKKKRRMSRWKENEGRLELAAFSDHNGNISVR